MNKGETYSFALNSMVYDPDIVRVSYSQTNKRSFDYDGLLVDDFLHKAKQTGQRQLVVFHLVGQHFNTEEHYPRTRQFERFSAHDIKADKPWLDAEKRKVIAHYDNGTLYNDHVLGRLFELYRSSPTALIYLSDHGEEVYDYRNSMGRVNGALTPERVRYQYEIPMVVWLSPSFRQRRPEVAAAVRKAVGRQFSSDNLCHLIFGLSGVSTPYYKAEHDLLSPMYKEQHLVLEGKIYTPGQ